MCFAYNTSRHESSLHTPIEADIFGFRKPIVEQLYEVFRKCCAGKHNDDVYFLCKTIFCIHFGMCDHNPSLID